MPKPPADHIDTLAAVAFTGYSRKTVGDAARRGEIPGAFQRTRKSPWYFTVDGLRRWMRGETDQRRAS